MAHGGAPHHHHHHKTPDGSVANLGLAFWLNLIFAIIELVGGFYFNSLAVLTDAWHDFGDALSLGVGYVLQRRSTQGPSENFSYGLRRLSLFSALLSGLVISTGAVYMGIEAITKFNEPRDPFGPGMFGLAILGIAINGAAAWRLARGKTQNEKVLRWHLIEDLLGWIAVLIGSLMIWLFGWTWMDPLLAIGIAAFILLNVLRGLGQTSRMFLQGNPDPHALRDFREAVESLPEVFETHDVHFWSLDGVRHILSLHVVVYDLKHSEFIKEKVRSISERLGDCHVTIEVESTDEHCRADCEQVES